MDIAEEEKLYDTARAAAAGYQDANAETKMAYLRAVAAELGMGKAVEASPQLQAALLDGIRETVGGKSLMQRAAFVRGVVSELNMDAKLLVNGERRSARIGGEKRSAMELA